MTVYKSKKVEKALKKKGFKKKDTNHSFFYFYFQDRRTSIFTKVSHGEGHDINDSLLMKIKDQLRLDKKQLMDLIECPLSQKDLERIYEEKGILTEIPRLNDN